MVENADNSAIPWPIAVMSFGRPGLLYSVLVSLRAQSVTLDEAEIYLFQDGNVDPFSGQELVDTSTRQENIDAFHNVFPSGKILASDVNLGVALNFDRAERFFFEEKQAEAAFFFEDDLLLATHYLAALRRLVDFALEEQRVAYVAAYGDHRATLEQQLADRHRIVGMNHKWGFGLTHRQWERQRPLIEPYLEIVKQRPYRSRDHSRIKSYFCSLGYTSPGTSQDAAKDVASAVLGTTKIMSYVCFGRYVGRHGVHQREENFTKEGYDSTALFPFPVTEFAFPRANALDSLAKNQSLPADGKKTRCCFETKTQGTALKPHMSASELGLLKRIFAENYRTYLEFGIGGSTVEAVRSAFQCLISVDSDRNWIRKVSNNPELRDAVEIGRAEIVHADIGPVTHWGNPVDASVQWKWPAYIERAWSAWTRRNLLPDLVFVDGRFRVACCLSVALIADQAHVLVHDIGPERPHYDQIFDYFETICAEQSLHLLRLKAPTNRLQLLSDLLRYQFDFR